MEQLPPGAFLRRDRGEALFVTDAPRRGVVPDLRAIDFLSDEAGGLLYLTPGPAWLLRLSAAHPDPPDHLCRTLYRLEGPIPREVLTLFAMGLKSLDGGPPDPRFDRQLRQMAALALREHRPMGGLYACGIVRFMGCCS